jgi:hypothetical protein
MILSVSSIIFRVYSWFILALQIQGLQNACDSYFRQWQGCTTTTICSTGIPPSFNKLTLHSILLHHPMAHIQCHFHLLTLQAWFCPEHLLMLPPSTHQTTFSGPEIPSDAVTSQTTGQWMSSLIKKTVGDVNKNYKLLDVAGLDSDTYNNNEVSSFHLCLQSFLTYSKKCMSELVGHHLNITVT